MVRLSFCYFPIIHFFTMIQYSIVICILCFVFLFEKCQSFRPILRFRTMKMITLKSLSLSSVECKPGSPVINRIDEENNIAYMTVAIDGEDTQRAFNKACDLFNEEVKTKGYKVAGFRPGAKLPPAFLYQMFGEDQVKLFCSTLLSEEIQDQCEKTGLKFVGRGRITQFNELKYQPGKPHVLEIECDTWPDIKYSGDKGYRGLQVTVTKSNFDSEKFEKVKKSILERYKIKMDTPAGYEAKMGDVIIGNMRGYEENPDGSKGKALLSVATGDSVEISLETGKFMPGLIEGLVGSKAGDTSTINVQFPIRPGGAGAALSGKKAIFDVDVTGVKNQVLPAWDADLAERVRPGLTLAELENEVQQAVEGDRDSQTESIRNDALAKALYEITFIKKLPDSLIEEGSLSRFQSMLADFKEQGSTEEQLKEMATPDNYEKYKRITKGSVEKTVTLSMVFRDIAEREKISVTSDEIKQQLDLMAAQAKQKGEASPDMKRAAEEIENVILRKKVFDFLASHAQITWIDAPSEPTK